MLQDCTFCPPEEKDRLFDERCCSRAANCPDKKAKRVQEVGTPKRGSRTGLSHKSCSASPPKGAPTAASSASDSPAATSSIVFQAMFDVRHHTSVSADLGADA